MRKWVFLSSRHVWEGRGGEGRTNPCLYSGKGFSLHRHPKVSPVSKCMQQSFAVPIIKKKRGRFGPSLSSLPPWNNRQCLGVPERSFTAEVQTPPLLTASVQTSNAPCIFLLRKRETSMKVAYGLELLVSSTLDVEREAPRSLWACLGGDMEWCPQQLSNCAAWHGL